MVMDEISPYLSDSHKDATLTLINKHVARDNAVYTWMQMKFEKFWFEQLALGAATGNSGSVVAVPALQVSDSGECACETHLSRFFI